MKSLRQFSDRQLLFELRRRLLAATREPVPSIVIKGQDLLRVQEVANMHGLTRVRIHQMVASGILPSVKFGHMTLIPRHAAESLERKPVGRPRKKVVEVKESPETGEVVA